MNAPTGAFRVNPRIAFFGVPPGRARDVMQALCILSDTLGRSTFDVTAGQLAAICRTPLKTVHRALEELSGLGYLTFTASVGYRTTYAVTLIEQRLKQSAQDTMSQVRPILRDLQTRHGVPSSHAPPGENTRHLVASSPPNTGHHVPSSPPNTRHHVLSSPPEVNTGHHVPSSQNSRRLVPSFPAGKPRGGRGGEEREGSLGKQPKVVALKDIHNPQRVVLLRVLSWMNQQKSARKEKTTRLTMSHLLQTKLLLERRAKTRRRMLPLGTIFQCSKYSANSSSKSTRGNLPPWPQA